MNIVIIATGKSLERLKKIEGGDITIAINKAATEYRHDIAMANDRPMAKSLLDLTNAPVISRRRHGKKQDRIIGVPMSNEDRADRIFTHQLTGVAALDLVCKFLKAEPGEHSIYLVGYDHGGPRKYPGAKPCSLYEKPAESFYSRFRGLGYRIYAVNSEKLSKVFLGLSVEELIISSQHDKSCIDRLVKFAEGLENGQ